MAQEFHSSLESAGQTHPRPRRRILFVTRTGAYGGTEKHLIELAKRLDPARFSAVIVCLGKDVYSKYLAGCGHVSVETRSIGINSLFAWWGLFRELKSDTAVMVHGGLDSFSVYPYIAARLAGIKSVHAIQQLMPDPPLPKVRGSSPRAILRRWGGYRARYLMGRKLSGVLSDSTICVSDAIRRRLVQEYGYPDHKTVTVHNGASLSEFTPSSDHPNLVRRDLSIGKDPVVIICTARLARIKGIDILLQALVQLLARHLAFKCILVGDGPLREELSAQVHDLGLSSHVFMVGFRDDVRPYLQAADIFVLPSHNEGLPLSVVEAMATGLPCIVTDVGGNSELVEHNSTGFVVRPGSADELATALSRLIEDQDLRTRFSQKARARAGLFDIDAKLMEIISQILLSSSVSTQCTK